MWPASTARPTAPAIPEANRWLALGAVAGPALFTLAWFVLGFLSPGFTLFGTRIAPYSAISQPISEWMVAEVLWDATHGAVSLELAGFFADEETARERFKTLTRGAGLMFVKGANG